MVQNNSQQATIGEVYVNEYDGNRNCDSVVDFGKDAKPIKCSNTAAIVIHRKINGFSEFYCKTHAMDTWLEMLGDSQ